MYKFQTFNTFDLDILGTYNYKHNNNITLNDCLYYHTNNIKNQNLFCKQCGKYMQMSNISRIFLSSNILIFSLNRGDLNSGILVDIPFDIQEKIDLTFYLEKKESPKYYELNGVTSIIKEGNKNKYVSFCKSPIDHQWYLYNDENVENIQLNIIINIHNNRQYKPCLLAYKAYDYN